MVKYKRNEDGYVFLRMRAEQLFLEDQKKKARKLIQPINQEQLRLFTAASNESVSMAK